ncbi:MAG TPA: VWA domain-containing protein [Candidatus Dormibacteraeota bacterium]|nr:VWA domain-containing protein [Candidatus Dormibacteraeota bacterium]
MKRRTAHIWIFLLFIAATGFAPFTEATGIAGAGTMFWSTPDIVTNLHSQQLPAKPAQRAKLPKPRVLDPGALARDPQTGELRKKRELQNGDSADGSSAESRNRVAIRARVSLVEVGCTAIGADGNSLKGLHAEQFRIYEDGAPQRIAHFDAATEPASIALMIDASPSVYRELGEMRDAARSLAANLAPQDEVAVVAFARQAHLLLPLTRDRAVLERALASPDLARVANENTSNIYQAVYLTARDLFSGRSGRKAILLLTDGQDSGLGLGWETKTALPRLGEMADRLTFEDIVRELSAAGIEVYAISTEPHPKPMTAQWLATHQSVPIVSEATRKLEVPLYTAYVAELVRRTGGQIYFLREIGTLGGVYRKIAETLREQYMLGYYPSEGLAKPGWRSLRVELPERAARLTHRAAYYVAAEP